MSEENNRVSAAKKKRAKTMKKLVILILMISMIICICCVLLLVKVCALNEQLQNTNIQFNQMNELFLEQQNILEELVEEMNTQKQEVPTIMEDEQSESLENFGAEDQTRQELIENELKANEAAHKVYLTFDDGPSIYTEEILEILNQYNVKATFFVVGKDNDEARELLNEIVENGHSLGMHSYSHKYDEIYASVDNFAKDMQKLQDYLYDVTGVKSTIYRFPGGSSNAVSEINMKDFAKYLNTQDITFYDWNISSGDGGSIQLSTQDLVDNCTKNITNWDTSVILLHDSAEKKSTVDALPMIIESILAMENTVILPITEETMPIQHIQYK